MHCITGLDDTNVTRPQPNLESNNDLVSKIEQQQVELANDTELNVSRSSFVSNASSNIYSRNRSNKINAFEDLGGPSSPRAPQPDLHEFEVLVNTIKATIPADEVTSQLNENVIQEFKKFVDLNKIVSERNPTNKDGVSDLVEKNSVLLADNSSEKDEESKSLSVKKIKGEKSSPKSWKRRLRNCTSKASGELADHIKDNLSTFQIDISHGSHLKEMGELSSNIYHITVKKWNQYTHKHVLVAIILL